VTLLDLALGPALKVALIIFVAGTVWRLVGSIFLARRPSLARPRDTHAFRGGLRTIFARFWTHRDYTATSAGHLLIAYVYHLGLVVVLALFVPHIQFFAGILGFSWPGIPGGAVTAVAAAATAALIAALIRRLVNPVLRSLSTFDDYFSWFTLFVPFLSGMLASAHLLLPYPTMLGLHILSVDLLLVWFPFGKLMHTFFFVPARYALGADYRRRGVIA
jgi:nitrate reductase gamma subunit